MKPPAKNATMGKDHTPVSWVAAWRPLAPFAALFVVLMIFAVGGMLVIAREADRSDASRAREAVTKTFLAMLLRLDSGVEMNAGTAPIASALSNPRATPASVYGFFTFTNSKSIGHYGTLILNGDGSAFAGTRFGLPWTGPTLTVAARMAVPAAAALAARGGGVVHKLMRDETGHVIAIAVANIPAGDTVGHRAAEPSRQLAMFAPVVEQLVPYMLPSLGVEDFRVVAANQGDNAVTIPVEHGAPVVFAWRPRTPGHAAIARWASAIVGLLLIALVLLALAGRANIAARRALEELAHYDCLTGLANRAAFQAELDRRQARRETIALGMIDLNGFKAVNDRYGHLVGDQLLQAIAAELAQAARPGDFVARLGGDEFALISPSRTAAHRFSEDFAGRIAKPLQVGTLQLQAAASVGIALAAPGMTPGALMAKADARLYKNKLALRLSAVGRVVTPVPDGKRPRLADRGRKLTATVPPPPDATVWAKQS